MSEIKSEKTNIKMVGEITDRIYDTKGNLISVVEGHNIVVNTFLLAISALLKAEDDYVGIKYWAVGQGSEDWDEQLPAPTVGDEQLTSEIGRVEIQASEMKYLKLEGESYVESSTPTNIIQIQHTFDENTLNGDWREFGIFAGDCTSAMNSGLMLNHRIHAVLHKTSEMVVERTMRFTLTLA